MTIRTDVTVDWSTSPRVIEVAAPSTEITIQDLHDTCKYFEDTLEGMCHPHLVESAGKEFLGGTTYVGITATLQNAVLQFEARGGPTWTLCSISGGNLVAVDSGGSIIDPRNPTAYVSVDRTASASATLQEQAALQYSSYNGGVTVDANSSNSGVEYPIGTNQAPVNNLSDALDIAAEKGFSVFYILGDITIDGGLDFTQISFVGESTDKTTITIGSSANVSQCEFYEATIQGTLDGQCKVKECEIHDVNYISGVVELCILSGEITLGGGASAYFLDCWAGSLLGIPPSIDLGGSGQDLVMQNFNGYIKWKNKSGAGDQANASLNAGWVVLDETITAGEVTIIGTGYVEDYSNGAAVNTQHLVNPYNITNKVWEYDSAKRLLGLMQENYYLDQTAYITTSSGVKLMTSGLIRVYDNASDVGTDRGIVEKYRVTASYNDDELSDYKVERLYHTTTTTSTT